MLHSKEGSPLEVANVVHMDDIGMVELCYSLNFAFEASAAVGILTQVGGEEFEGDFAIESGVLGEIDFPHATGTDFLDDPIVGYDRAICYRHESLSLVVVRYHTSPVFSGILANF